MSTRLRRRLDQAADERRGILMGFLPAGYPNPEGFREAARAAFESGLDALEVSMPGPAPALDGALIQNAALQAAPQMSGIPDALRLAASCRVTPDDSIVALAYLSTFESISIEEFLIELQTADIDAVLLPQHPMDQQLQVGESAQGLGIEPVLFLHRQEDLSLIASSPIVNPVIYLQSADLRTGGAFNAEKARERLDELGAALRDKPYSVCVGFGVRGLDEVRVLMSAGADGAIIGTRLVVAAGESAQAVAQVVDDVAPALVRRHATDPHPHVQGESLA